MIINNKLAFVFPGQGSQSVGMLTELASSHASEVTAVFEEASDVIGVDLWSLCNSGPEIELNQTENTQPAMLAAGVACYRVWSKLSNIRPGWFAGHSLGEYVALVCSEAMELGDVAQLVRERGRLMQYAVPAGTGAMAAILGLDDSAVVELCEKVSSTERFVSAANFNAPGQVVVAGHTEMVGKAVDLSKLHGAKRAVVLPVSVPSHCLLMRTIADEFEALLKSFTVKTPSAPIVQNVDAFVNDDLSGLQAKLVEQLYSPVQWVKSVLSMNGLGASIFVECGPGKVLTSLNKRISPESVCLAVHDDASMEKMMECLAL